MAEFKYDPEDLLAERSVLDIYRISKATPVNSFNVISSIVIFFILLVYVTTASAKAPTILELLRSLTADALAFAPAILGFLVAGFAIFLTPSQPQVFELMAKHEYEKSGFSYLKYNLSVFILIFIHYLAFFVLCFCIRLLCSSKGVAAAFLASLPITVATRSEIISIGISATFVLFGTWFFYVIMLLKSFIFNLYHIVMTSVALTAAEDKDES